MATQNKTNVRNNEDIVLSFVKDKGLFLFLGKEEQSFRLFKTALSTALMGAKYLITSIRNQETAQILDQLDRLSKMDQNVFVIIEVKNTKDHGLIRDLRNRFNKERLPIIALMRETGGDALGNMWEIGVNNSIVLPFSPINIIEKIANTLKPSGLSEIIDNCQKLLAQKQYQSVLRVCDNILTRKPGSSAAYMIKGDVYLAMAEEKAGADVSNEMKSALDFYTQAWQGNNKYIEPIKRLVHYYKKEGNAQEQLRFLKEIETLSPLNVDRKIDIGLILISNTDEKDEGIKFLDIAVDMIKKEESAEQLAVISRRITTALSESNPEIALRYAPPPQEQKNDVAISNQTKLP
jgi:hypothetical protein